MDQNKYEMDQENYGVQQESHILDGVELATNHQDVRELVLSSLR